MPVISTNTAANSALRYLNINSAQQTTALNRIASGSKVTQASDDAAGLAVATKLQNDVAVLNQAQTNASHGIAVLQTADGGMAEISDILERMKVLASQSLSGAVTDTERAYIDAEYTDLLAEIDSIATGTRFNGESLLDGTGAHAAGAQYLVGTDVASDTLTVTIADVQAATLGVATGVSTAADATAALGEIDTAVDTLATARAEVGATMSRFEYRSGQLATSEENLDAAQSAIVDADIAEEQANLSSAEVLTNAAIAALAQANEMPQNLLQLVR
ncbi:flagellin [Roseospira visakhapatnamensis]|uniref:Flagellin n=1 Tax=Roseospira visakhapatnamensis TaxID=390880 RepID=A0A7W6RBR8_9PROT|nr:flagellin [Roseospira visakhapatnamensis]MBB4265508.1 flagellin [Roseospira visakhapatnamensis]